MGTYILNLRIYMWKSVCYPLRVPLKKKKKQNIRVKEYILNGQLKPFHVASQFCPCINTTLIQFWISITIIWIYMTLWTTECLSLYNINYLSCYPIIFSMVEEIDDIIWELFSNFSSCCGKINSFNPSSHQ